MNAETIKQPSEHTENNPEEKSQEQPKYKSTPLKKAKLEVRPSIIQGYGVYAKERIKKGHLIEECPTILFTTYKEKLYDFVFCWNDKQSAFALGYGSLYNHSEQPNADYDADYENNLMVFTAKQTIEQDEEIFIDYGKEWFEYHNKKRRDLKKASKCRRILKLLSIVLLLSALFAISSELNLSTKSENLITPLRFYRDVTSTLHGLHLKSSVNSPKPTILHK